MEESINERVIRYIKAKKIKNKDISNVIGMNEKTFNNKLNGTRGFDIDTIQAILLHFEDLSSEWLLRGKGSMEVINKGHEVSLTKVPYEDSIPFYDLPVSAGELEMVTKDETPTGYIKLPGVLGKWCFPVIGCSMEPIIHAGDIVCADTIDSWERLDPDKVYMIITSFDRMIKHLEVDEKDNSILWCVSPNYKRFSIMKSDIKKIYKITFCGRLV